MNLLSSLLDYTARQIAALRSADTALDARIDQAIGAVAADAEVVDGRTGADGVTYTTIGVANRTQFSNLKADLNYFAEDVFSNVVNAIPYPYLSGNNFTNNGLNFSCDGRTINITGTSTGRSTYFVYGSWGATDNLILDAGETYYLIGADSDFRVNFFNSAGAQVLGAVGTANGITTINIPNTATGMQILYQIANSEIGQTFNRTITPRLYKWLDSTGRKIGMVFSNDPISITYDSNSTNITIPSNVVVLTPQKLITSSYSGTLTLTSGANWLSYDATNDEFRLGATRNGTDLYTVGLISHTSKSSFMLGEKVAEIGASREWGFIFSNILPTITYLSDGGCELSIPANTVILAKDGTRSVADSSTLTFNTANFLSYDVDDGIYRVGQRYQTHRLIVLGVISIERFEACYVNGVNLFINRTIAFMGDSITAGSGTSKTYHQYIGERFGFTCLNYGYGGSGYVHNYDGTGGLFGQGNIGKGVSITNDTKFTPNNVLARLSEVPSTVDGIVIFAGTNDWADGQNISFDSFVTGVDSVLSYVQTNFPGVPVLVMTPIHRKNDSIVNATTGKTLSDYALAIQEECRKFGILCIDTFGESGLHPDNTGNDTFYFVRDDTNASDGLHPNHFAHERLMRCIANKLNEIVTYQIKYMA